MSRTPTSKAVAHVDVAPLMLVLILSLAFALSIWAAFAPHPLPDVAAAAVQGGL